MLLPNSAKYVADAAQTRRDLTIGQAALHPAEVFAQPIRRSIGAAFRDTIVFFVRFTRIRKLRQFRHFPLAPNLL